MNLFAFRTWMYNKAITDFDKCSTFHNEFQGEHELIP